VWPLLLCTLAAGATIRQQAVAKPAGKPAEKAVEEKAPAPAEKPKEKKDDAPPTLETMRIKFEVENFNYYDLTKQTCPEKVQKHKHHKKEKLINAPPAPKAEESDAAKGIEVPKLPWMDGKQQDKPPPPSVPGPDDVDVPKVDMPPPPQPPKVQIGGKLPWMEKKNKTAPSPPKPAPPQKVDMAPAIADVHSNSDYISSQIRKGLGGFGSKDDSVKPPWMQKKAKAEKAESFLQLDMDRIGACTAAHVGEAKSLECTTIMDVLRDTIKDTVRGIINCLYQESLNPVGPSPGPAPAPAKPAPVGGLLPSAPAPAGAAFLFAKPAEEKKAAKVESAPAPAAGPAPGPAAPPAPDVEIFVTFSPGKKVGAGRSTIVEITFTDTPKNGMDDVKAAKPFLQNSLGNGIFDKQMERSLRKVTHIKPVVRKEKMDTKDVEQWNTKKCEKHIKAIVDEFTHHYTRQQVPMALYNECTNFMTRMSFSHDYVLDPLDTKRCRRATRKFEKTWNYGKNTKENDFEEMCHNACEAKYGRNAPLCNVDQGDSLLDQPLL